VTAAPSGTARDAVLARVRRALADAPPPPVTVPRTYRRDDGRAPGDAALLDLLVDRLEDYKARVHRCTDADLPATLARVLATAGTRTLVVPPDLPEDWTAGLPVELRRDRPPLPVEALDSADSVLTGCAVAVADTGTIVLDAGPDQGRRALTLVPDHHVCVVRSEQVVGLVPEALPRLDPTRPLTWISGPSATSDIELDRVEGVHGPRRLEVVLVSPS
jgi:L-lactate dehydrogenase complex protein LldG